MPWWVQKTQLVLKQYRTLNQQVWRKGAYSIVPIRAKDRYVIMEWRNEQMYHLRQKEKLRKENQDYYFQHVVEPLFDAVQPSQLLFSYLYEKDCIGYGGLVHINWQDRHAEISFVIKTALEKKSFGLHWFTYLNLIEAVAFIELKLHKIHTYAYDLRPHLYPILESANYALEARLKDHLLFEDGYRDILIHSKANPND